MSPSTVTDRLDEIVRNSEKTINYYQKYDRVEKLMTSFVSDTASIFIMLSNTFEKILLCRRDGRKLWNNIG